MGWGEGIAEGEAGSEMMTRKLYDGAKGNEFEIWSKLFLWPRARVVTDITATALAQDGCAGSAMMTRKLYGGAKGWRMVKQGLK